MCGIGGIIHYEFNRQVDESVLTSMSKAVQHRGPDGSGWFMDKNCGLIHRRLSVIDLSDRAAQPFFSPDNRFVIVYNGEVFNYRELRNHLNTLGFKFRTESDTEVLLYLFMQYGEHCLDKLNGMFAFAVWDNKERTLFMARDRVGVKPLYYSVFDNSLLFASEPKAIFRAGVPPTINHEVMDELLLFKYVAGSATVFKHIFRLLPGHLAWLKNGRLSFKRWWNLPEKIETNRENQLANPYTWFEETFYSAVKYRTISDVPVGLMLSGGLDSGSVAVALKHNGEKHLSGFTFTFDEPLYNEGPLAHKVCKVFGLDFNPIQASDQQLTDTLKEAAWLYDEPLVHQNDAQMLYLSKVAKKRVTVLLSGEGADELMGGYMRYKPLYYSKLLKSACFLAKGFKYIPSGGIVNRFEKLSRYLSDNRPYSWVLMNAANIYPADLAALGIEINLEKFEYRNSVYQEALRLYPDELARQAMYMDLFIHMSSVLDRNDRMTMGAGIECRVPFLDYRFLERIPALPSGYLLPGRKGKRILFKTIGQQLPEEVKNFRKLGFSVPWQKLLNHDPELNHYVNNIKRGSLHEFFPDLSLPETFYQPRLNPVNEVLMRQLVMIELWRSVYLDKF